MKSQHDTWTARSLRFSSLSALAVLAIFFSISQASAATLTWTGAGADNNWTTGDNWSGNAAPLGNSAEDLVFPSGASQLVNTNDFTAGTSFNSIVVNAVH